MSEKFPKFILGQRAVIACSGEAGTVIGRAEYLNDECQYQIRYSDARGVAVTQWWAESALTNPV